MLDTDQIVEMMRGLSTHEAAEKIASMQGSLKLEKAEIWPGWAQRAYRVEVRTVH